MLLAPGVLVYLDVRGKGRVWPLFIEKEKFFIMLGPRPLRLFETSSAAVEKSLSQTGENVLFLDFSRLFQSVRHSIKQSLDVTKQLYLIGMIRRLPVT